MTFHRGAQQRGNTDAPIVSQPRITGTVRRDSSGEIAGLPLPSTLKIECAGLPAVSVTFSASRSLNSMLGVLGTALAGAATAEDRDGCLSLASINSGEGAYIRIKPATSGFPDAAPYFGLRTDPHPLATVAAGDVERAEVRPLYESNPEGTSFIAHGADRTPRSFNRGLLTLSRNADYLHTLLANPIALPAVVDVDASNPSWAARLVLDADDNVEQIDLSNLTPISEALFGRIWVGQLTANSSLHDIGAYFKVLDADDNEIVSQDARVVRVVCVTRGQRAVFIPTFPDDWSAPTGALSDTTSTVPDGGNALGVDLVKSGTAAITAVLDRQTIVVDGATFVTDGVVAGDVVEISGSNITSPVAHNGLYFVDVVVSETQLVLRPTDPEAHGDLNLSGGVLGLCTVRSGGRFQDNLWLSFDPPIPPQKARGGIGFRIVLGLERPAGALYEDGDGLLRLAVRGSAEADGFTVRDLWGQFDFGGVYDGRAPRTGRGAGGTGALTRPISLTLTGTGRATPGTLLREGIGGATNGFYLSAGNSDEFTADDIGRIFLLTGGALPDRLPCLAVALDGNQRIRLHRLDAHEGEPLATANVDYLVLDGAFGEFPAALQIRSTLTRPGGLATLHESTDEVSTATPDAGLYGITALERVVVGSGQNLVGASGLTTGASDVLLLSFDPTTASSIFAPENDLLTAGTFERHATLVRVFQGPDAGWYKIRDIRSSTVTSDNAVQLVNLDESAVSFSDSYVSAVGFYNIVFGTNIPTAAGRWSAGRFFADWAQTGDATQHDGVLSASWRGGDADSSGLKIAPNNLDDVDTANGAHGWAVHLVAAGAMSGGLRSEAYDGTLSFLATYTPGTTAQPSLSGLATEGLGFLGAAVGQAGYGIGLVLYGSIWMGRSIAPSSTTWDDSSLVLETTAALGRNAYPIGKNGSEGYAGTAPFTYWDAPTRLGHPAVMYDGVSVAVGPPDSTTFFMPHDGVLTSSALDGQPPSSLLGVRVHIDSGADSGKSFRIVAVATDGSAVALKGPSALTVAATVTATLRGSRWREFHGDVADWTQIGSRQARESGESRSTLPILSWGLPPSDWSTVADEDNVSSLYGSSESYVGQNSSAVSLLPVQNGVGTGILSVPDADVTAASFSVGDLGSWAGTEWKSTYEPRAPFPNDGMFASNFPFTGAYDVEDMTPTRGSSYLSFTHPGNLDSDDFHLQHLTINTVHGAILGWNSLFFGGCLTLRTHQDNTLDDTSDSVRVWMRGVHRISSKFFRFRIRGHLWDGGGWFGSTWTLNFKLVREDGTVLASATPFTPTNTLHPDAFDILISSSGMFDDTWDALQAGIDDTQGVYVVLDVDVPASENGSTGGGVATALLIGQLVVTQDTRTARLDGGLELVGPLRATSIRSVTPVRGYTTVSPALVCLLNPEEFGPGADPTYDGGTTTPTAGWVEGHGVGLVQDSNGDGSWYRPVYNEGAVFRRGPSSASLELTHPFHDPLWYYEAAGSPAASPAVGSLGHSACPVVMCGPTGFVMPLDVPHGSRLTSLYCNLSVRAADYGALQRFGIYYGWEKTWTAGNWKNPAIWATRSGFVVKLWRRHSVNANIPSENPALVQGYAELICSQTIDIDDTSASSSSEEVFGSHVMLSNLAADREKLRVDRRHFDYEVSVEFYGGPRVYSGGDFTHVSAGHEDLWKPQDLLVQTGMQAGTFIRVPTPGAANRAPKVSLRCVRAGWLTDRLSTGGW